MSSLNPDGCRSTDSDFPISYRGHADPQAPAFFWILPEDPFATSCGYLDRDADGLLDWAETELAWVFRPYLEFAADEEAAGCSDNMFENAGTCDSDAFLRSGMTVFYQIHPVQTSMDGRTLEDPNTRLIRITVVFAFKRDKTHEGDTESIKYELMSKRLSTQQPFNRWQLHAIFSQGCPGSGTPIWCPYSYPNHIVSTALFEPVTWLLGTFSITLDRNMMTFLWEKGITEQGIPCSQASAVNAGASASICLPKVLIAEDKHRPYIFRDSCNYCCHGTSTDDCTGGIALPTCYGLPGGFYKHDETHSGFWEIDEYLDSQDILANQQYSPTYLSNVKQYLGNIGEFNYNVLQYPSIDLYNFYYLSFKTVTSELSLLDPYGFTYLCLGEHSFVEGFFQQKDEEHCEYITPTGSTCIASKDLIPNPAFIHYSSILPETLEINTCIQVHSGEDGDDNFSFNGFGALTTNRANYDPLQLSSRQTGIAGLYSVYPTEAAHPYQQEFIWDLSKDIFCGGSPSCSALLFVQPGGSALKSKFPIMPGADAFASCTGDYFWDTDQDGVPDDLDCEPRNPYLQWDLDLDGHCDLPISQGDLAACHAVCDKLYFSMTHWSEAYAECVRRCQGPHDNCSPLVSRFGVPYYDQNEASQCRALMQKFDGALLLRCQRWFKNPDQSDHNLNGVGDHCERRISDVRVDIRADSFGTNRGHFAWCPDPSATVSAVLSNDREMGPSSKEMLSVGLCVCPGQTEASCRDDSTGQLVLYCPSNSVADKINGDDFSTKDFAWNADSRDFQYFYRPVEAASLRDLGTLSAQSKLDLEVHQDIEVPYQRLLARWRDAIFQGARVFLTFRTDQFREFPGFQPDSMLKTFPTETVVPTHDRYSKLKFSSPQILEPEAVGNRSSEYRIPTHETWNPEAPTVEYDLIQVSPGMFAYDPEEDNLCVHFPRPVGQPVGYVEGSPLPVDPLWDPPRDLLDPLFGWIPSEDGVWRLFGVDPASFQVRSYVALPPGLDLREADLRFLRVDASLVGGAVGVWSTVAAALDRGTLYLRDPLQPGAWTQVPTGIPVNQTILAFHQATPETVWVISRRNLITAPTLLEVHLGSGAILRQQTLPDWTFVRVESLVAPRMGEAYFLIKRPAHLLPNLWKLDKDGLRADLALPALVPPDRGALAVDGRMGKFYLVARAATDCKASLWVHDLVTKTWTRLSDAVPVSMLREPRLALSGDRLVFSDLKDGRWWEWTQGRWIDLGNPLTREVGP